MARARWLAPLRRTIRAAASVCRISSNIRSANIRSDVLRAHTINVFATGEWMMALRIRLLLGSSLLSATLAASPSLGAARSSSPDTPDAKIAVVPEPTESPRYLHDELKVTQGSIAIAGHALGYQSEAGILVVHVKDPLDDDAPPPRDDKSPPPPQPPEAGMSYVA